MKITEVRIFPTESKDGKLKAFATMTFDDWFVVRNVKVIQGNNGLFVAMPSRKAMDPCPKCNFKNVRGSKYCNQCGSDMGPRQEANDSRKGGNHMDIAHPITQDCRVYIQDMILEAHNKEKMRQEKEGKSYRPRNQDDLDTAASQLAGTSEAERVTTGGEEDPSMEGARDIEL
ncbi:MAG: septation protein SpoVG family protein [Candidatus Omnitrophota bacterium]